MWTVVCPSPYHSAVPGLASAPPLPLPIRALLSGNVNARPEVPQKRPSGARRPPPAGRPRAECTAQEDALVGDPRASLPVSGEQQPQRAELGGDRVGGGKQQQTGRDEHRVKIGRATCRDRGESSRGGAGHTR